MFQSVTTFIFSGDLPLPPPPAPGTPPGASQCKLNSSQSWGAEEQELIKTLAMQHRNGSDASFKVTEDIALMKLA